MLDAVVEADGLADVLDPVLGVGELFGGGFASGEVGDDRDVRPVVGQSGRDPSELGQDRVHVW